MKYLHIPSLTMLKHGLEMKMIIISPKVCRKAVNDARAAMDQETGRKFKVLRRRPQGTFDLYRQ